jgi:selenide,water dikinase
MNDAAPIEKQVVLIGAGNAHLVFLRRWRMSPWPGVAVTLVSEFAEIPYSAMVPGYIAGDYRWDEITLDLVRFCRSAGARFVTAPVTSVDTASRCVQFEHRPPISYDVLSLGLGSLPSEPKGCANGEWSFFMRPLGTFTNHLDRLEESLRQSPRPFHLAVVGGGVSGCELSLAIRKRFANSADFSLTLLQSNHQLLPSFPNRVARRMEQRLRNAGIKVRLEACVVGSAPDRLRISYSEEIACDGVLWATPAAPPDCLCDSGLSIDDSGFLRVRETLQSLSHAEVFGTGDCVTFTPRPTLPRNGVHAVRQGRVLFDNVREFLHERPLAPFRPQRNCLCLINTADGEAILSYGPLAMKSGFVRRLKDRIDRVWLDSFGELTRSAGKGRSGVGDDTPSLTRRFGMERSQHLMRCGGCGAKVSGDVLSSVLSGLTVPDDPRVLLGARSGEDAGVHRVRAEQFGIAPDKLVEVQTVDYFRAFLDDPFFVGRIAALHSVSDVYAMNARPFSALAIATLPFARGPIQATQLRELLAGATQSLNELGVVLTGGHTSEGHELSLGFAVTGYADEDQLFRKSHLKPGETLILTKPLGTGATLAAWMQGECSAAELHEALDHMLIANASAAEVFAQFGARAVTDITGFGLAGHLLEMLDASRVSARLSSTVPVLSGFKSALRKGILSTLHPDNEKYRCRIQSSDTPPAWLFDPQTSGGLLGAVRAEVASAVLKELHRRGLPRAAVIGQVLAQTAAPMIEVRDEGPTPQNQTNKQSSN